MCVKINSLIIVNRFLLVLILIAGCKSGDEGMIRDITDMEEVALVFTKALADRDYKKAYSVTSKEFQAQSNLETMKTSFEAIVPLDWGHVGPLEIGETLTDWPNKRSNDVGWVYVSIGGDVYSEAIVVIVSSQGDSLLISNVEYGRP